MRILIIFLLALFLLLQYKLWFASGGLTQVWQIKKSIVKLDQANMQMQTRNAAIAADVKDLKQGTDAIEERAREELGMVKQNEVFYQVVN